MSTKPDPPLIFPVGKRKPRASFLDLFVSQAEIDKLRGELQLRQEVSKPRYTTQVYMIC